MLGKKSIIRSLIIVIAILAISFLAMDWIVFYRCGAVEQCIVAGSDYQNITKFAVTAITTLIAFFVGGNGLDSKDKKFLQAAFAFILCADFCMKIMTDGTIPGICLFMVVQSLFIFRHTRRSKSDNRFPRILFIPLGAVLLAVSLFLLGIFNSPTLPTVAAYGAFIFCSLLVACTVATKGYFPAKNAKLIKWGMILFFCCDICVGVSGATGADHSMQEAIATIAHNLVWVFYTPALVLLALSGYRHT